MRIFLILVLILVVQISACDQTVKDFVKEAVPGNGETTQPSTGISDGTMSLKVSPAKIQSTHANGAIVGNITLTNRTYMAGPDMAVNLTINRAPSNPQ